MSDDLSAVSMTGRMAYTIMCAEAYLKARHPDRDWKPVAAAMWKATADNWGDWAFYYSAFIPEVLLGYDEYSEELDDALSPEQYRHLRSLYEGISACTGDADELNLVLKLPHEMAMVYEGTGIGDGADSLEIIRRAEQVLRHHGIPLPDRRSVLFSSAAELHGWGLPFDGTFLSVIL